MQVPPLQGFAWGTQYPGLCPWAIALCSFGACRELCINGRVSPWAFWLRLSPLTSVLLERGRMLEHQLRVKSRAHTRSKVIHQTAEGASALRFIAFLRNSHAREVDKRRGLTPGSLIPFLWNETASTSGEG